MSKEKKKQKKKEEKEWASPISLLVRFYKAYISRHISPYITTFNTRRSGILFN